jgi:hypothetical protein
MRVMVLGDVHGHWADLSDLIKNMQPDIVLQCGDFGYFPRWVEKGGGRPYDPTGRMTNRVRFHWCDGNHEDHEILAMLRENLDGGKRRAFEIAPNVFWQDRGSTLTLPDGRVVLFMGGGDSTDKKARKQGRDWFPGELISWADMRALPDVEVDIVISHTCPKKFKLQLKNHDKENDPSRQFLDEVLERYKPKLWFFGHWHNRIQGREGRCSWEGLNKLTPMLKADCFSWLTDR